MGKHRHQKRYRRTVVAAVAVGVIGIPSVAMACTDWPDEGQRQDQVTAAGAEHRGDPGWYSRWSSQQHGEPTALPSDTPTATASAAKPGTPKDSGAKPSHKPETKAPGAAASKPATASPKPTTAAPKPTTAAPKPTTAAPKPTTAAPKPTTAAPKPAAPAPEPADASSAVAKVVELVNAERGKVGCSPVKVNATLTKAAQDHSKDMAASGTMSHTGSDGSSPGDRITRAGYSWSTYGENVAYGYSTPEQVMTGWMNSPGHKENILNCAFKEIGVGLAQPGSYWTQDFGTAR
ncbi:CAP domain-containing protein [Streptomyces sp. NRRL S-37]|uniref:CAP domain-containing protein n=1 Tax=Streptomyces sp. NRRL S-37 TaxID=1463903 RepID=UPI0004C5EB2E|nr:CAP domain-containing protein [Streptomyces sp. NRRL S-37]